MNTSALSAPMPASTRSAQALRAASGSSTAAEGRLEIVRDPLRLLLCILTVLTISRVHQYYPQLARLRPALLLVIAATGYAYLNPRHLTRANVLAVWPMRLVAVLGVLACCSAVFGISLGRTASFILDTYVKVLVYAFLLAVSIRHVRDLFTFVWAYVISCGILAFFSLFVFGISRTSNSDFARLSNLYMYDANDICVIMMVGLPLTLLLLVSMRGSRRGRGLLLLILLGISATIARSGSRGGFLGFIAVGAAALILVNSVSVTRRIGMMVAVVVALLFGAAPGYWKQMGTVLRPKDDYSYSTLYGRKALAERGIGYMAKYPLFGLGMNNFSRAECTISPQLDSLSRSGPIRCRAPHNSYVEAGAELGVPGLLVWVSLVIGQIVTLLRLRGRLPRSWRRGTEAERFMYGATSFFPLAMIGFAVTAFFVTFAWLDPLYIMAAFTTGLYVAVREQTKQRTGTETSTVPSVRHSDRGMPGWRVARSAQRFVQACALPHPRL
jgi:putative inorganic carbon (HCO3(-)) transporter